MGLLHNCIAVYSVYKNELTTPINVKTCSLPDIVCMLHCDLSGCFKDGKVSVSSSDFLRNQQHCFLDYTLGVPSMIFSRIPPGVSYEINLDVLSDFFSEHPSEIPRY